VCVLFRCGSRTCSVHVLHAPPFLRALVFSPLNIDEMRWDINTIIEQKWERGMWQRENNMDLTVMNHPRDLRLSLLTYTNNPSPFLLTDYFLHESYKYVQHVPLFLILDIKVVSTLTYTKFSSNYNTANVELGIYILTCIPTPTLHCPPLVNLCWLPYTDLGYSPLPTLCHLPIVNLRWLSYADLGYSPSPTLLC